MRVFLFVPCFVDQIFPNVAVSTLKVLEHVGCEVIFPEKQTCCGQPAYNSGYFDEARLVAMHEVNAFLDYRGTSSEKSIARFDSERDYIVGPSGSCTAMMRNFYPELLKDDPRYEEISRKFSSRAFELTEFISKIIGVDRFKGKLNITVSYHDSCHSLRELKVKQEPRNILTRIEGLKFVELPYTEVCCGFGGTFSVKFPDISVAMAEEKLKNFRVTGAEVLVSADTSCLMHLDGWARRNGTKARFAHIAEIMAESIS